MALLFKLSILLTLGVACNGYIRVCYFTNWAQYSQFDTGMVDPFLCTHILYAFGKLVGTEIQDIEWNDQTIQAEVIALKNTNPNLKVLLAIGGWTADNSQYVNLVASQTNMATFSTNAISYLRQRGFDGLDLDWEYPGNTDRGSTSADRARFTQWIQILQNSFIAEAQQSGKARLLLTAATAATMPRANSYYEISKLANYLDFVNIMAYDFHGQWDGPSLGAQHHSALYPEVNSSVIGWINAGFPANRLVLGMGAYGRGYKLSAQPNGNGVGAQPNGYDMQKYSKICSKINTGHSVVQLTNQQAVAAIGQTNGQWEWIGFDNANTFQTKARYIIANGLAGSMVWSLDQDDATNACGGGKYPLLSVLQNMLPGNPDNTVIFPTPTTSKPTPMWTPIPTVRPQAPPTSNCIMVWPAPPRCYKRNESVPYDDSIYYWVCREYQYAISCRCFLNQFYNPCIQRCDFRENKPSCSIVL